MTDQGEDRHARNSGTFGILASMPYLFDLDGTLIDSESAHKAAEVQSFKSLGYEFSEEDLFPFTGVPYVSMLEQIAPGLALEAFWEAHHPLLLGKIGNEIVPFYDVEECLSRSSHTPSALVTSSPSWYVDAVLEAFPVIRSAFTIRICADDITRGKPDPEPYALGASRLGFDASVCTAVEDSPNGVASAKGAGCYVFGIRRDDRLDLTGADSVIQTLGELSEVA